MTYHKAHDFVIFIDSDGTAMDSMNLKHFKAFGPKLIETFHLEAWQDELLERWNKENLFSMTRGMNRFLGCLSLLDYVDKTYKEIEGLEDFRTWVEGAASLSNDALKAYNEEKKLPILDQVLDWSHRVNAKVGEIADQSVPFKGLAPAIEAMDGKVDIVVISSANPEAIEEEWKRAGLDKFLAGVAAQDKGTKSDNIATYMNYGYDRSKALKIGDAKSDFDAAKANHILFYPILAKHEEESWEAFTNTYLDYFLNGEFAAHQDDLVESFIKNLSED